MKTTPKNTLKVMLAQLDVLVGDVSGNVALLIAALDDARQSGADILLTPELALSGYLPEDLLLRDDFQEQVANGLKQLQQHTQKITLVVGHPHRRGKNLYNAASVLRDGVLVETYRKHSLPNHTVFDEQRYFSSGDTACVFEQNGWRVGINICADVWHQNAPRMAAAAGADVLLVLNASPFHLEKQQERYTVVRERIAENQIPVLYCNMVGGQDELVFDGASFVMDNRGELTSQFPAFVTGLFSVVLNERAPEPGLMTTLPGLEASAYQALVLGLRDYVHKNRFSSVLLGLSGGVDSALTLAVAVDALGAQYVRAVMMPSAYTSDISIADSRAMAKTLEVQYDELSIAKPFDGFLQTLAPVFGDAPQDLTEENLQARVRGTLLMALSNKFGYLVVTTGNKSEMAVGYATLYGDMAGGFALLRDVSKTLVYRLCHYRNQISPVIPRRVLERAPSAELRPDQTDQDSLPDYAVLDEIMVRYVEHDQSVAAIIAAGFAKDIVKRVIAMIDRNEYKRRQAPPGVRITARGFGKDRRYPITQRFIAG
jgi:NAD+ synthetase